MRLAIAKRRYTIAEYLEFECQATDRHEYHEGEVRAMTAGSLERSLIAVNVTGELGNALKGKPCRVANCNLRVRISRQSRYVYPDALVFCGPPQFDPQDDQRHTLLNPRVIIEVLSPSTEAYDRGEKFGHYRQIESFEEYVLISQHKPNVESWLRQPDGAWSIAAHTDPNGTAVVRCLGVEVPLAEVYAGVEWPPDASKAAGG